MTQKPTKAEALQQLQHDILTLCLPPGADLDEVQLAEDWQLSRTPLRDILRQLAGQGYVEIRPNRGARVAEMSHATLRDFFLAAPMIYGAILRLASCNASAPQLGALKEAQVHFKAALAANDVAARALANTRFHEVTGEMAGNAYLLPSFQRLLIDHTRISMTFFRSDDPGQPDTMDTASQQHDAIISAIEARDEAAAGELALQHWDLSRHNIAQFVMPSGLDLPLGAGLSAVKETP